ncbi:MAG: terpene synthase family protein [Candidatus Dojkabacteria bacterium]|nr:terpene synthase family protein [Candidatus Dojkabacteria bacterium]
MKIFFDLFIDIYRYDDLYDKSESPDFKQIKAYQNEMKHRFILLETESSFLKKNSQIFFSAHFSLFANKINNFNQYIIYSSKTVGYRVLLLALFSSVGMDLNLDRIYKSKKLNRIFNLQSEILRIENDLLDESVDKERLSNESNQLKSNFFQQNLRSKIVFKKVLLKLNFYCAYLEFNIFKSSSLLIALDISHKFFCWGDKLQTKNRLSGRI